MNFHVGQRVVCINDRPRAGGNAGKGGETLPKAGTTYTIRELVPAGPLCRNDCVRLEEIVNAVRRYTAASGERVWVELTFRADRFRPIRTTNIEVFTAMLEPAPKEPAELVDA